MPPIQSTTPPGRREPWDIPVVLALLVLHLAALWAPFHFSWFALGLGAVMYWLTYSLGVSLGFHRMLCHRSFKAANWLRVSLVGLGCLALQGRPFYWVGVHRLHHGDPDGPKDPHSPRHGLIWSHAGWMLRQNTGGEHRDRAVKDLMKDPTFVRLNRWAPLLQLASIAAVWGLGVAARAHGIQTSGLSCLLWAVAVRVVVGYHCTWLVNSATHRWGYTNYATRDDARNLWWVALLSFGEGWHNNHHAHPNSVRIGQRWFELDVTWLAVRLLKALGAVRELRLTKHETSGVSAVEGGAVSLQLEDGTF